MDSLNDRHRAVGRHYDEVAYDYEVTRLEQHSAVERAHFTGAAEFRALFEGAFEEASFVGLESFTGSRQKIFRELGPDAQQAWLDLVEAMAATAEGIGLSEHFLFVGRPRSAG